MKFSDPQIMRAPETAALVQLSACTLFRLAKLKKFPTPIRLGLRAVGWRRKDVLGWIEDRAGESRKRCAS